MHTQSPIRAKTADRHFGVSARGRATERKYYLKAGTAYLISDGSKLTGNREHAWIGTIEQAANCRRDFDAAAGCKTVEA